MLISIKSIRFLRTVCSNLISGKAYTHNSRSQKPMASEGAEADLRIRESVTGISFFKSQTLPGGTKELSLLGVGVREKSFANIITVKVYAVGIYMEAEISDRIAPWKGRQVDEILKDVSFSKALIEAPVEKGLCLVLARDVGVAQFLRGFNEAIAPGLKAYSKNCSVDEVLADLSKIFHGQSLKKGTIIYFTWVQPSSVQIAVTKEVPTVMSPSFSSIDSGPLAEALFGMFLGVNPVSQAAKSATVTSLFS
ncbi:hypothetical protein O6H91_13G037500 [Diphasiastrum complanatum]|uniref:Uncharacterized protein n=2 Tax=Diphasiastrum complanatum TaxID=34168 RepID=A0ACC2BTU7_DIPCM|nr:hypothetical protein O6H91_13G037500 [Diphasiastrum complanatum]KAJ7533204.1 hypothetical protein O6H91_13G037500 [Diphasiastrum complanatum]